MNTLGPIELAAAFAKLARTDNVTFIVAHDGRILRTNAAWQRFAEENGGLPQLPRDRSLFDAIPPPLRPFYTAGFAQAAGSGEPWEHDYECSSPTVYRRFRMVAYPYGEDFLVTHSLLVERPHDRDPHEPGDAYTRSGVITMCSHCRRVRHATAERWDWVPSYVAQMPVNVSHGLCGACLTYYYADDADETLASGAG